jgi:manganese transport system permease protein
LTNRFGTMMAISAAIGLASSVGGLYASYYLNAASGSTIVLAATAFFFVSTAFSPKRRSLFTAMMETRARALKPR